MAHGIYDRALRGFLDAGGLPSDMDRSDLLVDVARDCLLLGSSRRARRAAQCRASAEEIMSDAGVVDCRLDGPTRLDRADAVRESMAAEMYEDPALAERFLDTLPEAERVSARYDLDCFRRPHPICIQPGGDEEWTCANCGGVHDIGDPTPRLVIGEREGMSELDYEVCYCPCCIAWASGAMTAAPAR